MPRNYYRQEIHLPRDLSWKLQCLADEMSKKLHRRVSKKEVALGILEQFFEKNALLDMKTSCNPEEKK